ncbi:hypothetical protein [Vulgatibacter incomptus]|uniref:Lipoprotein n=1 Tax=Vulgatibacter incomptus TaxID=1391653 RepID=A0A0K1PAH7_9BACT|nr:hypothetical protein [Vulgatibacter incomptus]AKU90520.1 hypothetical protein AKJ08_0907 [Vulgatibacter incomptus]
MTRAGCPLLLVLALAGCGAGSPFGGDGTGGSGPGPCTWDRDCPQGLVCIERECRAEDDLPPEQPDSRTFLPPAASERFVYALSPEAGTVAVIDPVRVSVESVPLPAEPVDLAVVPDTDAIVALSRKGAALSFLDLGGAPSLEVLRLGRRLSKLSLAPDASWALLWNPDGSPLDAGAEGLVLLVDVGALRGGTPQPAIERVAGRRHSHVFFRSDDGAARDAVVVGKDEISIFDLADPAAMPTPERVLLPPAFSELLTRTVIASEDGAWLLLASVASGELLVLDVEHRALSTLPLPGAPSHLAISGHTVVVTLRTSGRAAWFALPDAVAAPELIRVAEVSLPGARCETPGCTVRPGQARISADGSFALLFTDAGGTESFGRLDLASGGFDVFDRGRKQVRTLAISPDGSRAVILHKPDPDSTVADLYERMVDQAEGYSVVDLGSGRSQLVLTGTVPPRDVVFAEGRRFAAVTLRSDPEGAFRADAIDLETLVPSSIPLASAPESAGPLAPLLGDRIWVTQLHPAGRISFVDLAARSSQTVTGFELNGEIE